MERQKQESCRREPVTLRTQWIDIICLIGSLEYEAIWGFPGGSVVKNPPANVENVGSIPDLGRSYKPVLAPQLLSLCSRAQEQQLLSAHTVATKTCVP